MEKESQENVKRGKTGEVQSETARRQGSGDQLANKDKQKHENRENPDQDHVPGHKGYTREENQINVNPTRREP